MMTVYYEKGMQKIMNVHGEEYQSGVEPVEVYTEDKEEIEMRSSGTGGEDEKFHKMN